MGAALCAHRIALRFARHVSIVDFTEGYSREDYAPGCYYSRGATQYIAPAIVAWEWLNRFTHFRRALYLVNHVIWAVLGNAPYNHMLPSEGPRRWMGRLALTFDPAWWEYPHFQRTISNKAATSIRPSDSNARKKVSKNRHKVAYSA